MPVGLVRVASAGEAVAGDGGEFAIGVDAADAVAVEFGEVDQAGGIDRQSGGPVHRGGRGGVAGDEEVVYAVAGDGGDGSGGRDLEDAIVLLIGNDEIAIRLAEGRRQG